jgi:hypothetical protein
MEYLNEKGKPIGRTPLTNPYSYESYVIWKKAGIDHEEANGVIYTDNLYAWNPKKHERLCRKYFKNRKKYWGDRKPKEIEAFLREYLEVPKLELLIFMQGCNQINGSPLWIMYYKDKE